MASSTKIDTFDTVKTKIINNIKSLADTLKIASDDLKEKGFSVPDGSVYQITISIGLSSIDPETMIIDLLKRSTHLWDDLFAINPSTITQNQIEEIKITLPSNLSSLVSPLLECRNKDGKLAMDDKILGLLINYLRAFVKLGLKVVYFKRDQYEKYLDINLDVELKSRQVVGLPN